VVINNFNLSHITIDPAKTDPPLIVDPDTVLARAIPLQNFQPVAGWDSQIDQFFGSMQH
jgi:hypothetical protein